MLESSKLKYKFWSILLAVLATFLIIPVSTIYAGGGPTDFDFLTLEPFDQTHAFVIVANTTSYPNYGRCGQVKVNFSFATSSDGDSISAYDPSNNPNIIERHELVSINSRGYKLCQSTVKVTSQSSSPKLIKAQVIINGQIFDREISLPFGQSSPSFMLQKPRPDILGERSIGDNKVKIALHWNKGVGFFKYSLFKAYIDPVSYNLGKPEHILTTDQLSQIITVEADRNIFIGLLGCNSDDQCLNDNLGPWWIGFQPVK